MTQTCNCPPKDTFPNACEICLKAVNPGWLFHYECLIDSRDKLLLQVDEYRRFCETLVGSSETDLTFWKRRAQFILDAMNRGYGEFGAGSAKGSEKMQSDWAICGWCAGGQDDPNGTCPKCGGAKGRRIEKT
jgi:hypothetical protein